eukprot:246268_1
MYKYCNENKNRPEFETKILILNYVCVLSYAHKLKQEDNPKYYMLATWLAKQNHSDLKHITIQQCHALYSGNLLDTSNDQLSLLNMKMFQVFIRTIFLSAAVLLDVFYFETFVSGSLVMNKYGSTLISFAIFALILLLVWTCYVVFELYISNWNGFCYNMITTKHPQFILFESSEEIIRKCDEIYESFQNTEDPPKQDLQQSVHDVYISSIKSKTDHKRTRFYKFIFGIVMLHIAIISVIVIGISTHTESECERKIHFSVLYASIIMSVAYLNMFELFAIDEYKYCGMTA